MNRIIEVLLYPFTELAGWLVMRDLRRWARGYRVDSADESMDIILPWTGR